MSARSRIGIGSRDMLNKKVPENPRYKYVKTKIDTGASVTKYMAKIEDIRRNYRYKKDEIFKRMKVTTFVQLVLQVHAIQQLEDNAQNDSEADNYDLESARSSAIGAGDSASQNRSSPVPSLALTDGDFGEAKDLSTPRSTFQSVVSGIGEFDLLSEPGNEAGNVDKETMIKKPQNCPYLLLDLRDKDAYDQCHIITALNYPSAMLSRSCNYFTKEILAYRNQPGKIIVMYDEDERIATGAATTFAERGFDNTFVLSGGLKVAVQKFPNGLITGTLPASCRVSPLAAKSKKKVTPPPPQIIMATQSYFTENNLDKLQVNLEENLVPNDTGSRLSRATTHARSQASVRSSTSKSMNSVQSQPWK
ncbi:centrosomal protein of 41 kDa-like isoform X2 [Anneissia japonica]|uniref:centrosomal protein of 41 kDa-like isoform X2 n=1 Tax=Anneissia japonica TaxID=1529436 RepID=UPI001425A799|nr:centrosomal protein of 41 kDa-like isoform X2 [Anneissia japonica]